MNISYSNIFCPDCNTSIDINSDKLPIIIFFNENNIVESTQVILNNELLNIKIEFQEKENKFFAETKDILINKIKKIQLLL